MATSTASLPTTARRDGPSRAVVDVRPLAHLVVVDGDGAPVATPVPLIRRGDSLVGHLARPNPVLGHAGPALAIFGGDDAYVSPGWYPGKAIDGKVVPTWNYTTVHVAGRLVVHDDAAWTRQVVGDLSDVMERALADRTGVRPWAVDDAPQDWVAAMVRGIVGIELVDLRIVGKHKMSQNRAADDRSAVADGLDSLGDAAGSATRRVAAAIRATIGPAPPSR